MNIFKKGIFWAIISIVFGLLIFTYGCIGAGEKMQYVGAFIIAVGIIIADNVISEKKEVKE